MLISPPVVTTGGHEEKGGGGGQFSPLCYFPNNNKKERKKSFLIVLGRQCIFTFNTQSVSDVKKMFLESLDFAFFVRVLSTQRVR